ncbi:TipAS antibiotic-recognition domain-containing protein [Microbispora sp. NPDC049633]|uniref:TipAS antibiotic-recognition domain-containing protein n=1 Tax=Microbispora sp. NPDC049633 TaxID=3154355 RepID=UPI0034193420
MRPTPEGAGRDRRQHLAVRLGRRGRGPLGRQRPVSRYFDRTHSMHTRIGRMFAADARFAAHYDAVTPGRAVWPRCIADVSKTAYATATASRLR